MLGKKVIFIFDVINVQKVILCLEGEFDLNGILGKVKSVVVCEDVLMFIVFGVLLGSLVVILLVDLIINGD